MAVTALGAAAFEHLQRTGLYAYSVHHDLLSRLALDGAVNRLVLLGGGPCPQSHWAPMEGPLQVVVAQVHQLRQLQPLLARRHQDLRLAHFIHPSACSPQVCYHCSFCSAADGCCSRCWPACSSASNLDRDMAASTGVDAAWCGLTVGIRYLEDSCTLSAGRARHNLTQAWHAKDMVRTNRYRSSLSYDDSTMAAPLDTSVAGIDLAVPTSHPPSCASQLMRQTCFMHRFFLQANICML
jgi:hypothetical protein